MFSELRQHHIGCLVASIEDFKAQNSSLFSEQLYTPVFSIAAQDVKVCFLEQPGGVLLELVEPGPENKPLSRMLAKGMSFYHLGYLSIAYEKSVADLIQANCHQLNEFHSEAFGGKRCSFFFHPQLKLLELIEA